MGSAESTSQDERGQRSGGGDTVTIGNKDTLISLDLNAKQLWERLHGLSENLDSTLSLYPLRHSGSRHQQQQQNFYSRGSIRDLVTRCVDIMEGQQQALAAKDAQIAQLQAQLSALTNQPSSAGGCHQLQQRCKQQQQRQLQQSKQLAKHRRIAKALATRRARKLNNELASLTAPSIHDDKAAARKFPALPTLALPIQQQQQQQQLKQQSDLEQPTVEQSAGRQLRTPQHHQLRPGAQTANNAAVISQKRIKLTGAGATARPSPASIETPAWRICAPTKATYKLEGTEDLSDKLYESLHTRQEADERRRKLWDLRAQRERAYYDRLKQKALQRAANAAAKAKADFAALADQSVAAAGSASTAASGTTRDDETTKELDDKTKVRLVGKPLPDYEQRLAKLINSAVTSASPTSSSSMSSVSSSSIAGSAAAAAPVGRGRRRKQAVSR